MKFVLSPSTEFVAPVIEHSTQIPVMPLLCELAALQSGDPDPPVTVIVTGTRVALAHPTAFTAST